MSTTNGKYSYIGYGKKHSPKSEFKLEHVIGELIHNMVHAKKCGATFGHVTLTNDSESFLILLGQDSILSDKNFADLTKLYNPNNKDVGSMSAHGTGLVESLSRLNIDAEIFSYSSKHASHGDDEYATYKCKKQQWSSSRRYWDTAGLETDTDEMEQYIGSHLCKEVEEIPFATKIISHLKSRSISTFILEMLKKTYQTTIFAFKISREVIDNDKEKYTDNEQSQYKIGDYHLSDLFSNKITIQDVENIFNKYISDTGIPADIDIYINSIHDISEWCDQSSATKCVQTHVKSATKCVQTHANKEEF